MDRIALAKRLEGLSKVFASGTPYHRDLKAMAEVLTKVEDDKFQTILSADFVPDATEAGFGSMSFPGSQYDRSGINRFFSNLAKNQPQKAQQIKKLEEETMAVFEPQPTPQGTPAQPVIQAAEEVTAFGGMSFPGSQYSRGGINQFFANLIKNSPQQAPRLKKLEEETMAIFEPQQFDPSVAKNVAPMPGLTRMAASDGMFWNKEASEAIQSYLLKDVLGMDKAICCDTGRKLEKGQVPDGTHDGEKAPTLKPEQTPDQKDVLDSGIVEKSHGKVQKEASAESTEKKDPEACDKEATVTEEEKSAATTQEVKDKAKEEALKKLQKAQAEKEQADKAKKDKDANEELEASLTEGIELSSPMDDVTLDANEQNELSKLFV
jgi:predicted SnoaL-like aldol condensation-catalyzing enzyme